MRSRLSATVGAAALSVALPFALSMPAHAAPAPDASVAKKVASKVTIDGYNLGNEDVEFYGKVKAKAPCKSGRTVKLRQVDQGINVGKDKTNAKGKWSVTFGQDEAQPGKFKATLTKKVIKKGKKKTVCKAATATFTV